MGTTRKPGVVFACIFGLALAAACTDSGSGGEETDGTDDVSADDVSTGDVSADDVSTGEGSPSGEDSDTEPANSQTSDPTDAPGPTGDDDSDSDPSEPTEPGSEPSATTSTTDGSGDDTSERDDDSGMGTEEDPTGPDTTDSTEQNPDVEVEGSTEYSEGLEARASTLGTDAEGDLRWLFTVENTTSEPVCSKILELKLYDKEGGLIAGNGPDMVVPEGGLPIFVAEMTGSPYRMGDLVTSCIAPGEHGIGRGEMMSLSGEPLNVQELLENAGRIEYFFARRIDSTNYEPASDLLVVDDATLTKTAEGAVISGTASNGAALLKWTIHATLYDASGKLVDFVSTSGDQWPDGEPLAFELPAASAEAATFELYTDFTIWK